MGVLDTISRTSSFSPSMTLTDESECVPIEHASHRIFLWLDAFSHNVLLSILIVLHQLAWPEKGVVLIDHQQQRDTEQTRTPNISQPKLKLPIRVTVDLIPPPSRCFYSSPHLSLQLADEFLEDEQRQINMSVGHLNEIE